MRAIAIPETIREALGQGASLAISISGGKDSQALLLAVMEARRANGWTGKVFAIHANLGRAEWSQTASHCERICQEAGVELIVVSRVKGDLLQEMEERMEKLAGTGKPHFPSSAQRYCTSDQKRDPIDKHLRQYDFVISAEGIRAAESRERAKKECMEERSKITTATRQAYTWRPLIDWTEDDVWEAMGHTRTELEARRSLYAQGQEEEALKGWTAHPAYVMGNERLSCAICVLASKGDILNGARHNPAYYEALVNMEVKSGFSFRKDLRLADLSL